MTSSPIESIHEHFADVKDPRQQGKVEHPLINLIFITISGILCGADNWVAIEAFGNAQAELSIFQKALEKQDWESLCE